MARACEAFNGSDFDYKGWLANHDNIMCVIGDDVGLATLEYPGVYNAHWFYKSRGREALTVAFKMYDYLFNETDAQAVRGLTPIDNKAARYLAKRIGFETMGIEEFPDGVYDHMVLTKQGFLDKKKECKNG
jgi:hypothetical protein